MLFLLLSESQLQICSLHLEFDNTTLRKLKFGSLVEKRALIHNEVTSLHPQTFGVDRVKP